MTSVGAVIMSFVILGLAWAFFDKRQELDDEDEDF